MAHPANTRYKVRPPTPVATPAVNTVVGPARRRRLMLSSWSVPHQSSRRLIARPSCSLWWPQGDHRTEHEQAGLSSAAHRRPRHRDPEGACVRVVSSVDRSSLAQPLRHYVVVCPPALAAAAAAAAAADHHLAAGRWRCPLLAKPQAENGYFTGILARNQKEGIFPGHHVQFAG